MKIMQPQVRVTVHFWRHYLVEGESASAEQRIVVSRELTVGLADPLRYRLEQSLAENPPGELSRSTLEHILGGKYHLRMIRADLKEPKLAEPRDSVAISMTIDHSGAIAYSKYGEDNDRNLSVGDLRAVTSEGYVEGNPHQLSVHIPWGRGGGDGTLDLIRWLGEHGVSLAWAAFDSVLLTQLGRLRRIFLDHAADARVRSIALGWDRKRIKWPVQLRLFLNLNETWRPATVARRLDIPHQSAVELLRSLGYAPNAGGLWSLGTKKRELKRRAKWLRDETYEGVAIPLSSDWLKREIPLCIRCSTPMEGEPTDHGVNWLCPNCGRFASSDQMDYRKS